MFNRLTTTFGISIIGINAILLKCEVNYIIDSRCNLDHANKHYIIFSIISYKELFSKNNLNRFVER